MVLTSLGQKGTERETLTHASTKNKLKWQLGKKTEKHF